MKSILLIGLGRFGRHIAIKLDELHHQVMAVDKEDTRCLLYTSMEGLLSMVQLLQDVNIMFHLGVFVVMNEHSKICLLYTSRCV